MSEDFYHCELTLRVHVQEAEAIVEAVRISNDLTSGELTQPLSVPESNSSFRAHYPGTEEDPLADFFALFSDREWPIFGASASILRRLDDGTAELHICGHDVEIDSVSQLLFNSACSALPIELKYHVYAAAGDREPSRSGFVAISEIGRIFGLSLDKDYGAFGTGYVIAAETGDDHEPFVFWNSEDGFGDARSATIFNFEEVQLHCLPLGATRWMSLPDEQACIPGRAAQPATAKAI